MFESLYIDKLYSIHPHLFLRKNVNFPKHPNTPSNRRYLLSLTVEGEKQGEEREAKERDEGGR